MDMLAVNEKINEIKEKTKKIESEIANPDIISNPQKLARLTREYNEIKEILSEWDSLQKNEKEIQETEKTIKETKDEEMKTLAEEELQKLTTNNRQLTTDNCQAPTTNYQQLTRTGAYKCWNRSRNKSARQTFSS